MAKSRIHTKITIEQIKDPVKGKKEILSRKVKKRFRNTAVICETFFDRRCYNNTYCNETKEKEPYA